MGRFSPVGSIGALLIDRLAEPEDAKDPLNMHALLLRFVNDDSGAALVEYGLLGSMIAVVIITAITNLGGHLTITFTKAGDFPHSGDSVGTWNPGCAR